MSEATEGDRLEELDVAGLLDRLHLGHLEAVAAARRAMPPLARVVEQLVERWPRGGRLIYVGAGTSGRIGVLDAAECEPTFGVEPGRVVGVVAGGPEALQGPVEAAEDDEAAAIDTVDRLDVGAEDVVVGLSASGTTPYTCAALGHARERGAFTVAVTGADGGELAVIGAVTIRLDTGPELIEGSTRMKAGTAQKLICNALTTTAFVRLGRVRGRQMVAMRPASAKLRRRAIEIIQLQAGVDRDSAAQLLRRAGDDLPCALVMASLGVGVDEARSVLRRQRGDVARALDERRSG